MKRLPKWWHHKTFVNVREKKLCLWANIQIDIFVFKFIFCCLFLWCARSCCCCCCVNLIRDENIFLGKKNYFISKLFYVQRRHNFFFFFLNKSVLSCLEFYLLLRRLDFLRSFALTTIVLKRQRRSLKRCDVILLCKS